ncbi:MAG: hypothetical protein ACQEP6_01760 [Patescibacteria group bacterium]
MANTYHFIDTGGNLQSVEADNASVALETAHELGIHSGVMLVKDADTIATDPVADIGSGNYYHFIDTSGDLQGMWAVNSTVALETAHELGINSGVMLIKQ